MSFITKIWAWLNEDIVQSSPLEETPRETKQHSKSAIELSRIEKPSDMYNFLASVVGGAALGFKYKDFLPDDDQMDLDKAFIVLERGVATLWPGEDYKTQGARKYMIDMLQNAKRLYEEGDVRGGTEQIWAFEDLAFDPEP